MGTTFLSRRKHKQRSAKDCIQAAIEQMRLRNISAISTNSDIYRHYVLKETKGSSLCEREWKNIAVHLGIEWIPCSNSISKSWTPSWIPSISMEYMSAKYTNPHCSEEFVILVSNRSVFGIKGVIEHTKNGFKDPTWFTDFVPTLVEISESYSSKVSELPGNLNVNERIKAKRTIGNLSINTPLNAAYQNMDIEQVRTINAFFGEYLPSIEGICSRCFLLSLPDRGLGARWFSQDLQRCEVRLSIPKPDGWPSQQILYVTQQYKPVKKEVYVKYEGIIHEENENWTDTSSNPEFTRNNRQSSVHIPWEKYCYTQTVLDLPLLKGTQLQVCQCQTKML